MGKHDVVFILKNKGTYIKYFTSVLIALSYTQSPTLYMVSAIKTLLTDVKGIKGEELCTY